MHKTKLVLIISIIFLSGCTGPELIQIDVDKYPEAIIKINDLFNEYAKYTYDDDFINSLDRSELLEIINTFQNVYKIEYVYYNYLNELQKAMVDSLNKTLDTDVQFYAADPRRLRLKLEKAIELKFGERFMWVLKQKYIARVKILKKYKQFEDMGFGKKSWNRSRYVVQIIDCLKNIGEFNNDTLDIGSHMNMDELKVDCEYVLVIDDNNEGDKFSCRLVNQEIVEGKIEGEYWNMRDYYEWDNFKTDFKKKFMIN